MKRIVLVLVTGANVLTALWTLQQRAWLQAPAVEARRGRLTAAATSASEHPSPATSVSRQPAALSSSSSAPLHWDAVEADDYRTYIANLRNIGCPEATIRDLVTADIRALYEARRREIPVQTTDEYWRVGFARPTRDPNASQRLDEEEAAVLLDLLGPETPAKSPVGFTDLSPWLQGLPEATQTAIAEAWQRLVAEREALIGTNSENELTAAKQAQLEQLEREQQDLLGQALTPEERLEFDLRNSPAADALRQALAGENVSEAEFREQFRQLEQRDGHEGS